MIQTKHHKISSNQIPYIIAEIGLNHNGNVDLAIQMIEQAALSGAHCAKFQMYSTDLFIQKKARLGELQEGSLADFFRQFELKAFEWQRLLKAANSNKIDFLCSVFDFESLLFYKQLLTQNGYNQFFVKIASTDLTNRQLLDQAKSNGFQLMISTGASNQVEVDRTIGWVGEPLVLFQCVSSYPANAADYNLQLISNWQKSYNFQIGVSDHCEDNLISLAGYLMGASVIERHFTIDRNLKGPDQSLSITPHQLKQLYTDLQTLNSAKGSGQKESMASESNVRKFGRRNLYYSHSLSMGTTLSENDIIALRPGGNGVTAENQSLMIGKVLNKQVAKGDLLSLNDFNS
ncbi:MAG: N-acetylneuraminate synthase family protein [Leptonema sp. (in: Bacteria)]|nr:N-acetylneuraminate synthase family protein [Leptonema sp. (in: bacteria)]